MPLSFGPEIQADYFIWRHSGPDFDFLTKRGGLPYVESSFAWPFANGNPLVFLGQVCFCDSLDIIGIDLNFDTISIFADSPMPTNEPGTIAMHVASRKSGSVLPRKLVPKETIILPELTGVRVRLSVFPEFKHNNIYIHGYVDCNLLFPQGTYICKHIRSLQSSVSDIYQHNGMSGLASWSGVDMTGGIPDKSGSLDMDDPNVQYDEVLSSWMDLEAGSILIGMEHQQLIAEYQI
jgi:hypothetical protein